MKLARILICDGHNLAYRSFFAIRQLRSSKGVPTNAVFGFIGLVKSLISKLNPDAVVVVFDGGIPDSRMALLDTYKAQRPSMPDDLRTQMPLIESYLICAGIHSIRIDAQEADDVMATLVSKSADHRESEVVVATSDKDLFQMVDNTVSICPPSGSSILMGPAEVRAKTGVEPAQIVDWLALIGDSADNIPGVPGIGPKTASRLLNEFENMDSIFANLDRVQPERIRKRLELFQDLCARNVQLMTLDRSVDMQIDWENMKLNGGQPTDLLKFYDELEFYKLAAELRAPKFL